MIHLLIVIAGAVSFVDQLAEISDLERLIRNVESNEKIYQNIEVVGEMKFESFMKEKSVRNNHIRSIDKTFRSILQDPYIYSDNIGSAVLFSGERMVLDTFEAYDGEKTRLSENNTFGNIIEGKSDIGLVIRPHCVLLYESRVFFPLSELLRAIPELNNRNTWQKKQVESQYLGSEKIDDYQCRKIRLLIWNKEFGKDSATRIDLWFASDYNEIPIYSEGYLKFDGKYLIVEKDKVDTMKEIEPGIWFPMKYSRTVFTYPEGVPRDGRIPDPSSSTVCKITKVSLHPKYDKQFFTNIKMPKGAPVFEVKDKKIINSHREGLSNTKERRGSNHRLLIPSITIVGGLLLFLSTYVIVKVKRRSAIVLNVQEKDRQDLKS